MFYSISCKLSLSQNTKRVQNQNGEDELATLIRDHDKILQTLVASDISLPRNPVSNFSLIGKSSFKVLIPSGIKHHIPMKLTWFHSGNTRLIIVNVLIDTCAKVMIVDMDFVVLMIMPCIDRENRMRLKNAYRSLLK